MEIVVINDIELKEINGSWLDITNGSVIGDLFQTIEYINKNSLYVLNQSDFPEYQKFWYYQNEELICQ